MPPFSQSGPLSIAFSHNNHNFDKPNHHSSTNVVTIDVGGQLFQTTKQTLTLAGSNTLFSNLFSSYDQIPFIDRDPDLFSILLSVLRTGNFPSKAKSFDIQDIISEAEFYGIDHLLVQSHSNPSQFDAFNLQKSTILPLSGRDSPSVIATTPYGSAHVAHGSKITSFDWSLQRKSTILTPFTAIDSLLSLSSNVVAAGATDFSGLQVINLDMGSVVQSLNWENMTRSSSTVQAIGSSPEFLFTSFESGRRNSNSIMVYDINDGFRVVSEIARNEIFGADLDSAIPSTKLSWVSSLNLLMASGSHSGASGVSGNIKFLDIRSGDIVWEIKEKSDCFSDITVSDTLSAVFKIGVNSGDVSYIDFRHIDSDNSWNCLGDTKKTIKGKKEGFGCKIESHGNQVFCSKEGELEVWSEVFMGGSKNGKNERVFRKNVLGRTKDLGGNRVTNLGFSGNKMFVTRKDQQSVEVWESSRKGF
ncbi:BTB/POZ domain-containing protein At5g41330 [Lactuca sativa]|uniref:BTB domain-containing protein n=1 Tax=Lactuca sativa TaxID=4236 RepID=A0A9R1X6G2_LACSA|nr:BTB/POZ domain-containing protein At5g41330 [Lactuca sativa]KAJ0201141.1 hypothetical protein LSAT_V11C600301080 [Lactuca sativa]